MTTTPVIAHPSEVLASVARSIVEANGVIESVLRRSDLDAPTRRAVEIVIRGLSGYDQQKLQEAHDQLTLHRAHGATGLDIFRATIKDLSRRLRIARDTRSDLATICKVLEGRTDLVIEFGTNLVHLPYRDRDLLAARHEICIAPQEGISLDDLNALMDEIRTAIGLEPAAVTVPARQTEHAIAAGLLEYREVIGTDVATGTQTITLTVNDIGMSSFESYGDIVDGVAARSLDHQHDLIRRVRVWFYPVPQLARDAACGNIGFDVVGWPE